MSVIYAKLDDKNICIGMSQIPDKIESADLIEIEFFDMSLMGKHYNNGVWEENTENEN